MWRAEIMTRTYGIRLWCQDREAGEGPAAAGKRRLLKTLELRPLWSYFSRRAPGKLSGVASLKPAFD